MKALHLVDQRFGKLVVQSRLGNNGKNKKLVYWLCKCDCGKTIEVSTSNLRGGVVKSCGCYREEFRKLKGKTAAINRLFGVYKSTAKHKNHEFELDKFQFMSLVTDRCSYCGVEPQNIEKPTHYDNREEERWFTYNGIDRVDSSRGYTIDNCVSCCTTCNFAKRTMSKGAFLSWINRVYKHSVASISEKTPGMLIDELGTTLIKCFMAQEDIMNPKLSSEEQRLAAIRAQELNSRRNKLIRAMDSYYNLEDQSHTSKTYYTYFDEARKEELIWK
jgi:hypothetical protein